MKLPNWYEDPHTLHVGTMPDRSYYIPCADRQEALAGDPRHTSSRVKWLSGEWQFAYYPSPGSVPETAPTGQVPGLAPMPVPSVWQMYGFGRHQYTNVHYPFPYDPPYVPLDNPCGLYVRTFTLTAQEMLMRQHLNFEGVDAAFFVWVNGTLAGYSQVSHATSEFDITPLVREGDNTLVVLVLKWCDGSYLEDQDKLRMSGIFRDVYLLQRPWEHVRDWTVTLDFAPSYEAADIHVALSFSGVRRECTYALLSPDGSQAAAGSAEGEGFTLSLTAPQLWNAEQPRLYTLLVDTGEEVLRTGIGLREVQNRQGVLYLNGRKIKLRGVNRHDSDSVKGSAVSEEDVQRDLLMMKQHNINAVRTSHYPNAPYFPELCDRYGLYVIAEADLEAHGVVSLYGSDADFSRLSEMPAYREAYLDRAAKLYGRDKNRFSILLWSAGNESGYGSNIEAMLAYFKEADPRRLTHYESDWAWAQGHTPDFSNLDTKSQMYPSCAEVKKQLEAMRGKPEAERKPYLLCEYSHAMGNGPGDLEAYAQLLHTYDEFCGAFVWEWCDHAVDMGRTAEGKKRYFYGGDFGEEMHDGNFCMDGLVYPDRRVHSGLREYQNVLRPCRVCWEGEGRFRLENRLDFTNLQDCLTLSWFLSKDGEICASGKVEPAELDVPPHGSRTIRLVLPVPEKGHVTLRLVMRRNTVAPWASAGEEVGFEEIELRPFAPLEPRLSAGKVELSEEGADLVLTGQDFCYRFDRNTGLFSRLCRGNRSMAADMQYNIWRAPTDNDRHIRAAWESCGYDRMTARAYDTAVEETGEGVVIRTAASLSAMSRQRFADVAVQWTVDGAGRLLCRMQVKKNPATPYLPRFGVRLFLPKGLERVAYTGRGPYESYPDKRWASYFGAFTSSVRELHEDYLFPQENGSHDGCERLGLLDGSGNGWLVTAVERPFSFNASPYTQEMLARAGHAHELEEAGYTVLCLDYAQSGVGSNSCGPELDPAYRLDGDFTFTFCLEPQWGRGAPARRQLK